jgi:hypothetical protein
MEALSSLPCSQDSATGLYIYWTSRIASSSSPRIYLRSFCVFTDLANVSFPSYFPHACHWSSTTMKVKISIGRNKMPLNFVVLLNVGCLLPAILCNRVCDTVTASVEPCSNCKRCRVVYETFLEKGVRVMWHQEYCLASSCGLVGCNMRSRPLTGWLCGAEVKEWELFWDLSSSNLEGNQWT